MTHGRAAVFASVAALVALGASGCTGSGSSGGPSGGHGKPARVLTARLTAFRSCADAIAGLRRAAEASVGPYGLPDGSGPTGGPVPMRGALAPPENAAAGVPAAAAPGAVAASGTGAPAFSGTNTYVPGVDEPDLVKTDGQRIITLSGNTLEVVDTASRRITGRLDLSPYGMAAGAANLLLSGDHVLVLADATAMTGGPAATPAGAQPGAGTGAAGETDAQAAYGPRLLLVDLAGQPRVLSSYGIEGTLVDARQVGSVVRVITGSVPHIVLPPPAAGASGAALTAANRAVIAKATVDAWLPHYTSAAGGTTLTGRISCDQVSRPPVYSGADLLTVLTFDLSASALGTGHGVSIAADGGIVYGTDSSLYVASGNQWQIRTATGFAVPAAVAPAAGAQAAAPAAGAQAAAPAAGVAVASTPGGAAAGAARPPAGDFNAYGVRQQTEVYRFSISQPGPPRYVASGAVPGYLVDQYAMSEWGGYLRIATTTGTSWSLADGRPQGAQSSSSAVYVLTTSGPVMRLAGQVGGLGAGERIYSVRFEGPAGYVVTFRQTDPLYTVDLRDPARPRVAGRLDLTGYSSYLHPASGTQLIGIGQQADAMGHIGGTQVSLFDVADPASPQRLATFALSGANSAAEFDPHAFLYWPASRLVVIPIQVPYGVASPPSAPGQPGAGGGGATGPGSLAPSPDGPGALVLRIDSGLIAQAGFIRQPVSSGGYWDPAIERSLVIGNTLWTVSGAGLLASDLNTLRRQSWIPFA